MNYTTPDVDTATRDAYATDGTENPKFDVQTWPFYWLIRTHDRYLEFLEAGLKTVELDVPHWRVLMLLSGDRARSVSYLAKESCIKLSTMTRIVKRMQTEGLVETRQRASDARVTEVLLTRNGRRARPLAWHQADRIYGIAFDGVEAEEIAQLNGTLQKIARNLAGASEK